MKWRVRGRSEGANSEVLAPVGGVGTHRLFSISVEHGATRDLGCNAGKRFRNWVIFSGYFGDRRARGGLGARRGWRREVRGREFGRDLLLGASDGMRVATLEEVGEVLLG